MDAELVRKTLKMYNLTIKNAILIKLNTIIYLYENCHLPKKKMGRKRRRNWKTSENEPENGFFGLISWNFQDFIKNHNMPCTSLLVQISKEFDRIYLGE